MTFILQCMRKYIRELGLVAVTLVWGLGFVFTKNALDNMGPITFIASRFVIGSIIMLAVFRQRAFSLSSAAIGGGAAIGTFLGAGYIFQTIGLQFTTNSNAAFITGLYVVVVPFLAFWLLKRKPSKAVIFGIFIGTIGLALLSLDDHLRVNTGDLWVMACAVMFACHLIAISYFVTKVNETVLASYQIFMTSILAVIASFLFERPSLSVMLQEWQAILYTGVLCTAFAFFVMTWAQRKLPPSRTALILLLESPAGAFFGWLLAGEVLNGQQKLGCLLIFAAMIVSELRPRRSSKLVDSQAAS